MQEKVLNEFESDELSVFVVWIPVLRSDNHDAAKAAPVLIPDARAMHYWDGDQALGQSFGRSVELPRGRDLAWDTYFVFDAGVSWDETDMPVPTDWAHQLGLDERHLREGAGLQAAVASALARLGEGARQ